MVHILLCCSRGHYSLPPFVFFSLFLLLDEKMCFLFILLVLYFQATIHATFKDLSVLNLIFRYPVLHVTLILFFFTTIAHHPLLSDPLILSFGTGRKSASVQNIRQLKSIKTLLNGLPSNSF